jgi:spermidine/putrescine transport system substrate-binding protein
MHSTIKALAASLTLAAFVSGCGGGSGEEDRVDLTAQALAAAEASGFVPAEDGDGGVLHIYIWSDYISPDVLESFENALGVKVVIDTFDSNEAMYAKMKAGGTGYDLIVPSSYQVTAMAQEGMIEKLDHARIPNVVRNFDPAFAAQILDPGFTYSVPYAVTYTGFAYLKNKIPEGVDVATWGVLANEAFKGRISLLDDLREVIGAGLMSLGYSINSENPAEIDAAVAQVLKWRANIRKFDSESYKTEVPSGATWLGHGYSTDVTQVIVGDEEAGAPARDDIGFALPREGFAVVFDEMVIASGAKRKDLAYAFINYIYDGEVAAANMDYICGPTPVRPGIELLDDDYRSLIMLSSDELVNGQLMRSFDGKPEVQELYNKAWDRIKATEAK